MDVSIVFLRTSKASNGHSHISWLSKDNMVGATSTSNKHSHQITYQGPIQELTVDVSTGRPVDASTEGTWHILPANDDGHTHSFSAPIAEETKREEDLSGGDKNNDGSEQVTYTRRLFKEAKDYEHKFRKKARESVRFYEGDQWDNDLKQKLESKDRAALTINEIEPKIDLLSGYQRQNRSDIRYFPVEDGDSRIADILTTVVKVISEKNGFSEEENEVFVDEMVVGRGLFNARIDFDTNIYGDIVIEKYPWDDCWFGPHRRKDLGDLEYLIKGKWFSFAKVKKTWPDKADTIQKDIDFQTDLADSDRVYHDDPYGNPDESAESNASGHEFVDIARKEYRVLECWHKKYERVFVLVNPKMHILYDADGWAQEDVDAVKTMPGFHALPRIKTRMFITKTAGGVLLSEEEDKYFDGSFGIIPVYAKKNDGRVWGKVEAAKDPQKEINKRHSQSVDILNKVATYGWFYESSTFTSQAEANKFRKNSSSPGFHSKVTDIGRIPVQTSGVKFPKEIVALETLATDKLHSIMNINPELLGRSTRSESGVALAEKKRQGLIGNEFLFDNLAIAKKTLGRIYIKLIQKVYTPQRILRIVKTANERNAVSLGNQPFDEIDPDDVLELLTSSDLSKYDVAIGESAASPTTKHANFAIWAELSKTHPETIPLEILIDLSDLPEKEKVKRKIEERAQLIAGEADKVRQGELQKTLAGKQLSAGTG